MTFNYTQIVRSAAPKTGKGNFVVYGESMKRKGMLMLLTLLTLVGQGQRTAPVRPGRFALGMTQGEVLREFGKPPRPYAPYSRHTRINEYQLRLDYEFDDSASRLHPVLRLDKVDLMIDRPQPTEILLRDIPEAVELCATGCGLLGVITDFNFNYSPHIIAYPLHPTEQQSSLAALIGTHWRPESAKEQWVPALVLNWKTSFGNGYPPVDWLTQKIETATFTAIAPSVEQLRGTHQPHLSNMPDHPAVDLGTVSTRVQ